MGPLGQARPTMDTMGPLGQARPNMDTMGPLGQARPIMDTMGPLGRLWTLWVHWDRLGTLWIHWDRLGPLWTLWVHWDTGSDLCAAQPLLRGFNRQHFMQAQDTNNSEQCVECSAVMLHFL